jgi:hypothetical protein
LINAPRIKSQSTKLMLHSGKFQRGKIMLEASRMINAVPA